MALLNWLKNLEQSTRLGLSSLVASFIVLFLPAHHLEIRLLSGWSAGIFCYLALVLMMMNGAIPEKVRYYARHQEPQHSKVFLLVVFIACTSLFAIAKVLADRKDTFTPQVGLSVVAVVCSWLLMHTTFALHYATLYYSDNPSSEREVVGGLQFSSEGPPNFWDFMYFTFTLGMTSQTSDTVIVSSKMRRLALGHTIVSFYFYSVIIALTVSIVSGLI
jgi:uncharacterized membrane protein